MKFRPCIDLHDGKVKQIVGSTLSDTSTAGLVTNFETNLPPAHYANLYKKDKLAGGHIIMLGSGNESAALEATAAFKGGFHVGGGITPDNAMPFLDAGASHVIVTSYVFKDGEIQWNKLDALTKYIGKKRLVLDLSCKRQGNNYVITTDRWQKLTSVFITQQTLETLSAYCDEFLVHAAHVEGKQKGIDERLVALLANISPIPVTYAGGVRSIDDLELVKKIGQNKVDATAGSALDIFGGSLSYADVVAWHKLQQ